MVEKNRHIGRLLETVRKIRRMTADEVAARCNVTRSRYYQWEKERFILPKNLPALSIALEVPLPMLRAENGKARRRAQKNSLLSKIALSRAA